MLSEANIDNCRRKLMTHATTTTYLYYCRKTAAASFKEKPLPTLTWNSPSSVCLCSVDGDFMDCRLSSSQLIDGALFSCTSSTKSFFLFHENWMKKRERENFPLSLLFILDSCGLTTPIYNTVLFHFSSHI